LRGGEFCSPRSLTFGRDHSIDRYSYIAAAFLNRESQMSRSSHGLDRRAFLESTLATAAAGGWSVAALAGEVETKSAIRGDGGLQIATFEFDVTPPKNHSLCGGWITPVKAVDDPLLALGFVILGAGKPIVICTVDWTGLLNGAHVAWRAALAEAAATTPDRVAVQCVHQHNAPFACTDSQKLVDGLAGLPVMLNIAYFESCLEAGRKAVRGALARTQPLTHVATGQGKVEKVASNRRFPGPKGTITQWRGSASKDPVLQKLPEGMIDPWLKTVAFYSGAKKVASLHYYATHPMSYYGDGRVTSDFVGLARRQLQKEEPGCRHIYFTGCAGNIAAGKYNDGSKQARVDLTERMVAGLVASEKSLRPRPINEVGWKTVEIVPEPRKSMVASALEKTIADPKQSVVARCRGAFTLAWIRRCEKKVPIVLSGLSVNDISLLHLPSESFLEYQLRAQKFAPSRFVATAAYGDGGPWYIPVREAYPQGGYEVSVAFCEPSMDPLMTQGIERLLG